MKTAGLKKRIIPAVFVLLWLLSGCIQEKPVPVEQPETPAETQTLYGTLTAMEEQRVTLLDHDGTEYVFEIEPENLTVPDAGAYPGYPVEICYTGGLTEDNLVLQSVTVRDFSACTAEEQARHMRMVMTDAEKVGQMFLVHYPGGEEAARLAQEYHLGGYILFAKDFEETTPEGITAELADCQRAQKIPMVLGVDEEGGGVNRVSLFEQFRERPFASPQWLYANGGLERVAADAEEKCALLSSLGINLNLAPVCDVSQDPGSYIYYRTLGRSAEETARYAACVVEAMEGSGVGCVLKHFPGYGGNSDTHTGMAVDQRSYQSFQESDFLPFQAGIDAGAGAVLISHNIVSCMDGEHPASLSPEVHRILRDELGFQGVIITDDLVMEGIRQYTGDRQAAVAAVLAGNDVLCCNDFETQIPAVLQALEQGDIDPKLVDDAVERILTWKIKLNIVP